MTLRERDFIQICTVMKMSRIHIVFKELIPNISSFILINFIMIMRSAITSSVGIMTLGLAAFEPSNWGVMLHRARMQGLINPAVISFMMKPLCTIILFEVGAILFTNGLDEILNPRLRKE
jgi:peptide/nickel transport system permease protein